MMNQEEIADKIAYLVENFDIIKEIIEKEKSFPKPVFGFRKNGGLFSDNKQQEQKQEAPLEAPATPDKEKPLIDLYSLPEETPTSYETKEETNDTNTNNNIFQHPNNLLRASVKESRTIPEENVEPTRTVGGPTDKASDKQVSRPTDPTDPAGGKPQAQAKVENPWDRHKKTKSSGNDTESNESHKKPLIKDNDQLSVYEKEYKEKCEKKGIEYVPADERHRRAKEGAQKYSIPFNDFRKLW